MNNESLKKKENNPDSASYEANISVEVQIRQPKWKRIIPNCENFCGKVAAFAYVKGLEGRPFKEDLLKPVIISLVLTGNKEVHRLNNEYRHKDAPTNVLTFVNDDAYNELFPEVLLGDVIISLQVTEKEALEQNKQVEHHLAHLIIHGVLHLLGFDHETGEEEAENMEELEIKIMYELGYPNPYAY